MKKPAASQLGGVTRRVQGPVMKHTHEEPCPFEGPYVGDRPEAPKAPAPEGSSAHCPMGPRGGTDSVQHAGRVMWGPDANGGGGTLPEVHTAAARVPGVSASAGAPGTSAFLGLGLDPASSIQRGHNDTAPQKQGNEGGVCEG
jgi:hypothetical protein